ncbi:MAG: uridine kinase [Candidatus Zixiibacteriota bacterium]
MKRLETPFILGLGGPSCSGKTELAVILSRKLDQLNPIIISIDSFYKDLSHLQPFEREKINFDHPSALDFDLMISHINELIRGEPIRIPIYDYATHTRLSKSEMVTAGQLIIIEGIFAFCHHILLSLYNVKIFLDLDDKTALKRRLWRDINFRQRTEQSIKKQFYDFVLPMQKEFIHPGKDIADLIISGIDPLAHSADKIINLIDKIMLK